MNRYDRYYGIAKRVSAELPGRMGEFYANMKLDRRLCSEMDKDISGWMADARIDSEYEQMIDYNMETFIMHLIATSESATGLHEDRVKFRNMRRNRKLYLKTAILKESSDMEKSKVLKHAWEEYSKYMNAVPDARVYGSSTEYYKEKTEQVVAWADTYTTDLIDYPFFKLLSAKKQYKDFVTDCSFHVFDLLTRYYGDELPAEEKEETPVMRSPDFISGKGMFAAISSVEDLQAEVVSDAVRTYNNHTITTEDGEISIKTIIDRVPGNYKDINSKDDKDALIETLSEAGSIKLSNSMLDSTDMDIFTYIFSAFNVEDVNRGRKTIKLRDLVKHLYTEAKDERKNSVIDHLDRLSTYMVEYTARNADGMLVEAGDISFFNVIYHIDPSKNEGRELTFNASLRQIGGQQSSYLDEVKKYKADEITVEILPSANIRDAIVSSMNTVIYEELYKRISAPKAKNMLMYLQSRRATLYPKTSCDMSVAYLAQYFHLEKYRRSIQVKHLTEMIQPLMDEGVLIKDYSVDKTNIHIEFLPFSDTELAAYHIGDRAKIMTK